jgi:hypothetical protein
MQNLKKPEVADVAGAIAAVRTASLAHMQAHYERPLAVVGDLARALVVAAPGHRLFIADLSGIEARGAAWVTGDEAELVAWREFDRSNDPKKEPYYQFGTQELKINERAARTTGKVCTLAFQYGGSLPAWRRLAPRDDNTPDEQVYANRRAWRRRHPAIVKFWATSIRQAINAIESKQYGRFTVARIAFQRDERFLHMELPSGRRISYPYARIYVDEQSKTFTFRDASGGRFEWYHAIKHRGAHGGLVLENATQAVCRDVFVEAMLRLEAAGYRIVAHLHDEFVCEVPNDFGNLDEFISIITRPPAWAPDFPIAAKGRISDRLIEIKDAKAEIAEAIIVPSDIDSNDDAPTGDGDDEPTDDEDNHDRPALDAVPPVDEPQRTAASASADPSSPPPPQDDEWSAWDGDPPPRGDARGQGNGHATDGLHTGDGYSAGEQSRGSPVTRYIYKDAHGKFYMRVTRTSRKNFPTAHWHDGKWVNGWPATVIPYRLPELIATPASEPVWITEGEKDADNVADLGLIATSNPGGAKQWQPELAQWFKGKQLVYILEDNDADGHKHTSKILAALRGIVPEIVTVSFPELPEKGDVSDWLDVGGNRKLLIARAEQARKRGATPPYIITNLSTVMPRATKWMWFGHLARGALELMAGTPEIGKSQIQCQYIACATTGRNWPNNAPGIEPCRVIMLTAEDTTDSTLVPRLRAAGADLRLVEELKTIRRNDRNEAFLLGEDLGKLEQIIHDFGDVGLVTVDPITAYMGHSKHFDSHRTTDVRSQLMPLKELAERTNIAFSAVTHPPKNAGPRALDHFIGSQAFIAAARIGHLCVPEMEEGPNGGKRETGRRFYTNPKINIAARQTTLIYQVAVIPTGDRDEETGEAINAPVIQWAGQADITADEALAATKPTKGKGGLTAQDFLADYLAGGPQLQTAVIERGAERGFTERQLRHAKAKLSVVSFKKGFDNGAWFWALPEHVPQGTDVMDNVIQFPKPEPENDP